MLYLLLLFLPCYAADNECKITIQHQSESSDSPTRTDVYDSMMLYFFKGNGTEVRDHIKPYLQRKMQRAKRNSKLLQLQEIPFEKVAQNEYEIKPQLQDYINKRVSKAMEEAFKEEHAVRMRYQFESEQKLTKSKAAIITGITTMITAVVTAGVTIAITITQ